MDDNISLTISVSSQKEKNISFAECMKMLETECSKWRDTLKQQSHHFEEKIKKAKSESDNKVANLYRELQIRDLQLKDANEAMCSLQEKRKPLEADKSENGVLKGSQRRIQELETENESLKLKGMQSLELEQTFEEKIVHLQKEIATSEMKMSFMI